jgi:iron complex outermembrane receptor protein
MSSRASFRPVSARTPPDRHGRTCCPWRQLHRHDFAIAGPQRARFGATTHGHAPMIILFLAALGGGAFTGSARAQHAFDDPLASANDAFGLTLGLESIGMYNPSNIRGFNPQTAGNVRIDGLYFDQQGALSNRVVEGSTVRIGVSEIGYAFPAPTGIVDYNLRQVGDGTPSASVVTSFGPFQARGLSIDAVLPVASNSLQIPAGASYQISTSTSAGYPNPGYTSSVANVGATPLWKPTDWLTVRTIIDWTRTGQTKTLPYVFTAGDFLPPETPRGYLGQNWAEGIFIAENYGAIVKAQLSATWSLAAGVFRSVDDIPVSYSDLYINTLRDGSSEHVVVGNPAQDSSSTSGELSLTGHFASGPVRHEIVVLARGRNTLALYGGSDAVSVGTASIDQGMQVSEPSFTYSDRSRDRTEIWSEGLAYRAQWQTHGDLALGIQRENYDKDVITPGASEAHLALQPWRAYGSSALALGDRATLYAGYTQGLEDSGVAPSTAENRGTILPAALTWQTEFGLRYLLTPSIKLVGGIFEIQKPYFNFDTASVDRLLGIQRDRGFELSLSGEVASNLHVTAGLLLGDVEIRGQDLAAQGVGPAALGQARVQSAINANYKSLKWPAFSADIAFTFVGAAPATLDDRVYNHAQKLVNIGGRYKFSLADHPATLRVQVQNSTNDYFWNLGTSPGFSQVQPRSLFAYLTVDL